MLGTTSDGGDPKAKGEVLRASDRVAAVVAYCAPTDIAPYKNYPAMQFELDRADDFSPLLHVTPDDPPTLLIHGDEDKMVPLAHSEKILVEFQKHNVPAELLVIHGAAHGFRGDDGEKASQALGSWFEKHLLPK